MRILKTDRLKKVRTAIILLISSLIVFVALGSVTQVARGQGKTQNGNLFIPVLMTASLPPAPTPGTAVYYLSPVGNDSQAGTSPSSAWATFGRAFNAMVPGDTLILMDGVYYQSIDPNLEGRAGAPITIKAQNDGKAILDGEGVRTPIYLRKYKKANYYVIEGLVVMNGNNLVNPSTGRIDENGNVIKVETDNNIFRRVSAYNAGTDGNSKAFSISGNYNLLEDCVASGSGRKMIMVHKGTFNTVRRCFANWESWDGRVWHDAWPWGDNIQIYNADDNLIENSIGFGSVPLWSISIQANSNQVTTNRNRVLGSIAMNAGMNPDGTVRYWGCLSKPEPCASSDRPQPAVSTHIRDFDWADQRVGFDVHGSGEIRDNLFQDIFAWGNAGLGLSFSGSGVHPNTGNNVVRNATLVNNGRNNPCGPWPCKYGGIGTDVMESRLSRFSISNSYINEVYVDWPNFPNGAANMYTMNGTGARLKYRYVDGVLTNQPLWPWPMEGRIKAELGISVTNTILPLLQAHGAYK